MLYIAFLERWFSFRFASNIPLSIPWTLPILYLSRLKNTTRKALIRDNLCLVTSDMPVTMLLVRCTHGTTLLLRSQNMNPICPSDNVVVQVAIWPPFLFFITSQYANFSSSRLTRILCIRCSVNTLQKFWNCNAFATYKYLDSPS